jgi:hypothetical protein
MRKLIVKIGKDFGSNKWSILFTNLTYNFHFECEEGFEYTTPFPGRILDKNDIKQMIEFLQQTLEEKQNEQNKME